MRENFFKHKNKLIKNISDSHWNFENIMGRPAFETFNLHILPTNYVYTTENFYFQPRLPFL